MGSLKVSKEKGGVGTMLRFSASGLERPVVALGHVEVKKAGAYPKGLKTSAWKKGVFYVIFNGF